MLFIDRLDDKADRAMGRRDHVKKAYVSLKPGQELNLSGEAA